MLFDVSYIKFVKFANEVLYYVSINFQSQYINLAVSVLAESCKKTPPTKIENENFCTSKNVEVVLVKSCITQPF